MARWPPVFVVTSFASYLTRQLNNCPAKHSYLRWAMRNSSGLTGFDRAGIAMPAQTGRAEFLTLHCISRGKNNSLPPEAQRKKRSRARPALLPCEFESMPLCFVRTFVTKILLCCFFCGLAAAASFGGRRGRRFADQLGGPDGCDESLHSVIVKIDCSALVIGFGDDSHAVLLVAYGLAFD